MLPPLRFESFQTGFVEGGHAACGIFAISRAAELSREWDKRIFVAQLDLKKAFDRVTHSAVLRALKLQSASLQCMAVLSALLLQSEVSVSLGPFSSPGIRLDRGLAQGAPESPLVFVMVTEMVLRRLLARWKTCGRGWCIDAFWLAAVAFADDIVLVSSSKADLEVMISEVVAAFLEVGLEVGLDKTHWTSWPASQGDSIHVGDTSVAWESHLIFVGGIVDLSGNCGLSLNHRLAQAEKTFHRWKHLLLCRHVRRGRRLFLTVRTVIVSLLWLAATWTLTKSQQKRLESWAARLFARVGRVSRMSGEDLGQYWRRLHRQGHSFMRHCGGGVRERRLQLLHRFAGHIARMREGVVVDALRTRCLAWWRYQQNRYHSKWDGVHPRRFHVWRWEAQLTNFYGEVETPNTQDDVGWILAAQDRDAWRCSETRFAKQPW
jgi:hypothetical protein